MPYKSPIAAEPINEIPNQQSLWIARQCVFLIAAEPINRIQNQPILCQTFLLRKTQTRSRHKIIKIWMPIRKSRSMKWNHENVNTLKAGTDVRHPKCEFLIAATDLWRTECTSLLARTDPWRPACTSRHANPSLLIGISNFERSTTRQSLPPYRIFTILTPKIYISISKDRFRSKKANFSRPGDPPDISRGSPGRGGASGRKMAELGIQNRQNERARYPKQT